MQVIEPDSSEEEEFKKAFSWSPQAENFSVVSRDHPETIVTEVGPRDHLETRGHEVRSSQSSRSSTTPTIAESRPPSNPPESKHGSNRTSPSLPKNVELSEPDILLGVQGARQDREDAENGEEEIFGDYEADPRPDSVLSGRKKGFLSKLSIAKWGGKKKSSKNEHGEADTRDSNLALRKSLDDLDSGSRGSKRESSVTRIAVEPDRGAGDGEDDAPATPTMDDLTSQLTKAMTPGSRKSLYSGFIRPDDRVAKSDDSGIIATSRPESSTGSNLQPRQSYSGSSGSSDLSPSPDTERSKDKVKDHLKGK